MHALVKLAKDTVEAYTRTGKKIAPPKNPCPEMLEEAGVFVSLKKRGELRGCIGTFMPTTDDVAHEIIQNAVSAAAQDPRFAPVTENELDDIDYSVDVLMPPEKVAGRESLDPKKYGVIVQSGDHKGLLLPDLEGVDTISEQLSIAAIKAGILPGEEMEIYRFEVKRYK